MYDVCGAAPFGKLSSHRKCGWNRVMEEWGRVAWNTRGEDTTKMVRTTGQEIGFGRCVRKAWEECGKPWRKTKTGDWTGRRVAGIPKPIAYELMGGVVVRVQKRPHYQTMARGLRSLKYVQILAMEGSNLVQDAATKKLMPSVLSPPLPSIPSIMLTTTTTITTYAS